MMKAPKAGHAAKGQRSRSRLGSYDAMPSAGEAQSPEGRARLNWAKLPALVILAGSLVVLYTFFANPRFRVEQVVVQGANLVSPAEIERVVAIQGLSIFHVHSQELQARLMREFSCLARAAVTCRLPNQVFVTVEERDARLVWESQGRSWWIGAAGQVLGETSAPGDLPVIHDIHASDSEPGTHLTGFPWELAEGMFRALPVIRAYDYTPEEGLIVYATASQWPIYLGHKGNAPVKVAIMKALLEQLVAKGVDVEYVDLRNEQRPTFKNR